MPLRALDDQAPLDRYLELKEMASRIKDEMDQLKPQLLSAVMEEPNEKGSHAGWALSVQRRKTYSYSDEVVQLQQELKALKKLEEAQGVAVLEKQQAILVVKFPKS